MADLPPIQNSSNDTGTPRWVKVFGIIAVVVVLLIVIHLLTGGGPGMHASLADGRPPS
jgi:hypothetical protein